MGLDTLAAGLCSAFARKDANGLAALFSARGLFEFPLIGQRLIGPAEIRSAARRIFDALDDVRLDLHQVRRSERVAISEGSMSAKRRSDAYSSQIPFCLIIEAEGDKAQRISIYLDAHGRRLWVDGPVFAAG